MFPVRTVSLLDYVKSACFFLSLNINDIITLFNNFQSMLNKNYLIICFKSEIERILIRIWMFRTDLITIKIPGSKSTTRYSRQTQTDSNKMKLRGILMRRKKRKKRQKYI